MRSLLFKLFKKFPFQMSCVAFGGMIFNLRLWSFLNWSERQECKIHFSLNQSDVSLLMDQPITEEIIRTKYWELLDQKRGEDAKYTFLPSNQRREIFPTLSTSTIVNLFVRRLEIFGWNNSNRRHGVCYKIYVFFLHSLALCFFMWFFKPPDVVQE